MVNKAINSTMSTPQSNESRDYIQRDPISRSAKFTQHFLQRLVVAKKISDRWASPGLIATMGTQVDEVILPYELNSSKI